MSKVEQRILDATCGGRSIWYPGQKDRDDTLYVDIREEPAGFVDAEYEHANVNPGYSISPDECEDFRDLPYSDATFDVVVFDPPHAVRSDGMQTLRGFVTRKFGALHAETWQADIRDGFKELWRVLRPRGVLVFKFADESADFREVLELAPTDPLFGTSVNDGTVETRWYLFYKEPEAE